MRKIALFRILGNDLETLHGQAQTAENLKFTLEFEGEFEGVSKFFLLNRIVDVDKKAELVSVLDSYGAKYFDLPFEREKFDAIRPLKYSFEDFKNLSERERVQAIYSFNIYLVNNNSARNWCIEQGFRNCFDWVLPFDSNNFIPDDSFSLISRKLKRKTQYLAMPQHRIWDAKLSNEEMLARNFHLDGLPVHEPQLGFAASSELRFNEQISYGCGPKAELLNALGIKGIWNRWCDNEKFLDIETRHMRFARKQTLGAVIRLNPQSVQNERRMNWDLRLEGLFKLVSSLES